MLTHVLKELAAHRARFASARAIPPLLVGVQGPQGSGKTFLTSRLRHELSSPPHALAVAVLSIDDLYLPHAGLAALASAHPQNGLLRGRGQPGTHDVPLGAEILESLRRINDGGGAVNIPRFDKSLFGGEGDRAGSTLVSPPIDVVVLEGWCVGFYPISAEEIDRRWALPVQGLGEDFFVRRGFRKEDVVDVNERLKEYVAWWECLHVFIQINPADAHPYEFIYRWRLQQEHHMKSLNGGKGMTDQQVESFVDRYIPGYVFFGDGVLNGIVDANGQHELPPWMGHGLKVQIGENREVVDVTQF
ncbi:P-loop containing nucleoside triphosphate hydrolase protein [Sparassis latifolia]